MVTVSVIIPVYNTAEYLRECLDSVCQQTLINTEVICIDDGSTDESRKILNQYIALYEHVKIFMQNHLGVSAARNLGILEARGEYIAFMDSDDFYPSLDVLEVMYKKAIEKHVLICGGTINLLHERNIVRAEGKYSSFSEEKIMNYLTYQCMNGFSRFLYSTVMLKKNNILFSIVYQVTEDVQFLLNAMLYAKKFLAVNKVVYCYRIRHKKRILDFNTVKNYLQGFLEILKIAKTNSLKEVQERVLFNMNVLPVCRYIIFKNQEITQLYKKIWHEVIVDKNIYEKYLLPFEQIGDLIAHREKYEEKFLSEICKFPKCVIYGNGYIADFVMRYMQKNMPNKIKYILVSKGHMIEKNVYSVPIHEIDDIADELDKKSTLVIVATLPNVQNEICNNIYRFGFQHILNINFQILQCYPGAFEIEMYL